MRIPFELEVGLEDSELISYRKVERDLELRISAWNSRELNLNFKNVIGLSDLCAGDFSDGVEETELTSFFRNALEVNYISEPSNHSVPDDHPFHLYQFLNLDGFPSLEVVAELLDIVIE